MNSRVTRTRSPTALPPRTDFGTGSSTRPLFSRHTLVFHRRPSTEATTGIRPQASDFDGAYRARTVTKVHPPLPGMRQRAAVNLVVMVGMSVQYVTSYRAVAVGWICQP